MHLLKFNGTLYNVDTINKIYEINLGREYTSPFEIRLEVTDRAGKVTDDGEGFGIAFDRETRLKKILAQIKMTEK